MKQFYEEIDKLLADAERIAPVYNELKDLVYNHPVNRDIKNITPRYQQKPDGEYGYYPAGLTSNWMYSWAARPIVFTAFGADSEWIAEHILSVLREKYRITWGFEIWGDVKKLVYTTEVKGVPVSAQLIDAQECRWVEVPSKSYKFSCV